MYEITLRTLSQISTDELQQIAQIEAQHFADAWQIAAIEATLGQFGAGVLLAMRDKCVIGYCIYTIVFETAEILRIATCKRYQRQGIGKQMMERLIDLCQTQAVERLLLEVRADNNAAIALYHQEGFAQIDRRKDYYHDQNGRVDALILQRTITPSYQSD